jgi:hypothetical protein
MLHGCGCGYRIRYGAGVGIVSDMVRVWQYGNFKKYGIRVRLYTILLINNYI